MHVVDRGCPILAFAAILQEQESTAHLDEIGPKNHTTYEFVQPYIHCGTFTRTLFETNLLHPLFKTRPYPGD